MKVATLLSMLHEGDRANSATRRFRNEPVLAWTLRRLSRSSSAGSRTILCWDDQRAGVDPIAAAEGTAVVSRGRRTAVPAIDAITAARNWADGWRGGLMGACECDRGFFGPWAMEILTDGEADALLLIDPSAGLIDPGLVDGLIAHARVSDHVELCFSPAAPGLSGMLVRHGMLAQLAAAKIAPGWMLSYRPDLARKDPIGTDACAPIPTALARTTHRFTLDTDRQIAKLSAATAHLNGTLVGTDASGLLAALNAAPVDPMPHEVVLELTTARASSPVYWPGRAVDLRRPELTLDVARRLFDELSACDDMRLTLAGVGDPLLHPGFFGIIDAASAAGIRRIAIETDFLGVDAERINRLADSGVDVVSVNLPANSRPVYAAVMGADAFGDAFGNMKTFVDRRQANGRGTPLLVPTFVKCGANLCEMETWYDQWLRTLGTAVIAGPSTYGGLIPDVGVADMTPPRRRPCARLASRLTVLSDGTIVSCEQDVSGKQPMGRVGEHSIEHVWRGAFGGLRERHVAGQWDRAPLCAGCKEWHRP